jgi:hypothetical protein
VARAAMTSLALATLVLLQFPRMDSVVRMARLARALPLDHAVVPRATAGILEITVALGVSQVSAAVALPASLQMDSAEQRTASLVLAHLMVTAVVPITTAEAQPVTADKDGKYSQSSHMRPFANST